MGREQVDFFLVGGDMRQAYLAEYLIKKGCSVASYAVPTLENDRSLSGDFLILPLPVSNDGIFVNFAKDCEAEKIRLSALTEIPYQAIFGGRFDSGFLKDAKEKRRTVIDYFNSEFLQGKNALLTAEGAIRILMEKLPKTVFGANLAVIGYGRIGSLLTDRLRALGASVSVFERKRDKHAQILSCGAIPHRFDEIDRIIKEGYDAVFNTVPAQVLTVRQTESLPKKMLWIELASAPGGIDPAIAIKNGLPFVFGGGLPGKYAPESAGELIAEEILFLIGENFR